MKEIKISECDENGQSLTKYPLPVNVRFMGLWDTVEALGWPDHDYSPGEANTRYADQLCNVQNVAHALSLDDNRARIFTPMLLSQRHIIEHTCDKPQGFSTVLNEVWFSGAHSDVGGGNDTDISGVSLNWMLDMMDAAKLGLIHKDAAVYGNYLDVTHEGDSGLAGLFYKKVNRDLAMYIEHTGYKEFFAKNDENAKKGKNHFVSFYDAVNGEKDPIKPLSPVLKVHQSVLDRLCVVPSKNFESQWYKNEPFKGCIKCDGNAGYIKSGDSCESRVKAVRNPRYKSNDVSFIDNTCDKTACWRAKDEDYAMIQACNYSNSSATGYASERLEVRDLAKIGDKAIITFYADKDEDHTGVNLRAGMTYRVSVHGSGIEGWKDCIYLANIEDGRPILASGKSFPLTLVDMMAFPIAHSLKVGYMGLLGQIDGKNYLIGKLAVKGQVFTPHDNGELVLRVNEPRFLSSVYKNNHGRVELLIEAVDGREPAIK